MQIRVFTIRQNPETGDFDDAPMRDFLAARTLVSATPTFFMDGGSPTLTVVATFHDEQSRRNPVRPRAADAGRGKGGLTVADLRQQTAAPDLPLFDALRSWRADQGSEEGKPAYAIISNAAMVALVRERPATLTALSRVPGLGEARVKNYGATLLAIGAAHPRGPDAAESAEAAVPGDDAAEAAPGVGPVVDVEGGAEAPERHAPTLARDLEDASSAGEDGARPLAGALGTGVVQQLDLREAADDQAKE